MSSARDDEMTRLPGSGRPDDDTGTTPAVAAEAPAEARPVSPKGDKSQLAAGEAFGTRYLNNHWIFEKVPGGCRIDFFVDFEFQSRILQRVIELLFHEAVRRMVAAFETRARQLYGAPTPDPAGKPAV